MSNTPKGQDWWQASDQKWYPPELRPETRTNLLLRGPELQGSDPLATDVERDEAVAILREGFVSGQLSEEEHNERVESVLRARTVRDLAKLTADLGPTPPQPVRSRKGRVIAALVGVALVLGSLGAVAVARDSSPPATTRQTVSAPTQATAGGLPAPPATPSLTGSEFVLYPSPKSDFLGIAPVFSASGSGSQTSPPFVLNGGVLNGTFSQAGSVGMYLVPVGGSLDQQEAILGGAPHGTQPWSGLQSPGPGTFQLKVEAEPGTQWSLALNEFWITPPGVTVATSATVADLGSPVFLAVGTGNWQSGQFTLPEDPIGRNEQGAYSVSVIAPWGAGNVVNAYLVPSTGPSISLPLSGSSATSIPNTGPFTIIVEATGPWAIGIEYGTQPQV